MTQELNLQKVHVCKKGSTVGRVPGLLLGNKDNGILIRMCTKVGCDVPVGLTRACDMDVYTTELRVYVTPTQEEIVALAQLSNRLGSYEKFYELAIPEGVDPLFVRYQEFFPNRFTF